MTYHRQHHKRALADAIEIDWSQAGRIAAREVPPAYEPPPYWTPEHVDVRLTEAFEVLVRLPAGQLGPRRLKTLMPDYAYDATDIANQKEIGELEKDRLEKARQRGIRRFGFATCVEIARMERAIEWPIRFLQEESVVAKAVGWAAFRKAVNREDAKIHHSLGVSRRTFFRYRLRGLQLIANGLNLNFDVVF